MSDQGPRNVPKNPPGSFDSLFCHNTVTQAFLDNGLAFRRADARLMLICNSGRVLSPLYAPMSIRFFILFYSFLFYFILYVNSILFFHFILFYCPAPRAFLSIAQVLHVNICISLLCIFSVYVCA